MACTFDEPNVSLEVSSACTGPPQCIRTKGDGLCGVQSVFGAVGGTGNQGQAELYHNDPKSFIRESFGMDHMSFSRRLDNLDVLAELPERYKCSNLLPSLSTVAPNGCEDFFSRLLVIKNRLYAGGDFQMQFSIHTTDQQLREKLIPIKKWDFVRIADYGAKFYVAGDKKIALNFALAKDSPICVKELKKYFDPRIFIIKITPVNPTISSMANEIKSYFVTGAANEDTDNLLEQLRAAGYEVILSIGELEENKIGSNCGQSVRKFIAERDFKLGKKMYSYDINFSI